MVSGGNRGGIVGASWEHSSWNSQPHMQIRLNCSVARLGLPEQIIPIPTSFLALSPVGIKKSLSIYFSYCLDLKKDITGLSVSTLLKKTSYQLTSYILERKIFGDL